MDRAAKLPKNSLGILAVAPSRRGDVQVITRRVGERTALAGRRLGLRCLELRRLELGRLELRRLGLGASDRVSSDRVSSDCRSIRPSPWRSDDPHWRFCTYRGPASGERLILVPLVRLSIPSIARRAEFSKLKTAFFAL